MPKNKSSNKLAQSFGLRKRSAVTLVGSNAVGVIVWVYGWWRWVFIQPL